MMQRTADVVVIGGGIVGCAAAYYLARRGVAVTLLERGRIGGQQSGRNWGFVRQQGRDPLELPLMIEANRIWQSLEHDLGADVEWVQGGNLALAADERRMAQFESWLKVAREFGLDTRLLGNAEIRALVPSMQSPWAAGLYTASDGHAEPVKATEAFGRAAAHAGAIIVTGCAVERIDVGGGAVTGVATEQGEIRATQVVCATGAWSARLLRPLALSLPQRVVRATVARTRPVSPITPAGVWAPTVACRQRRDGSLNLAAGGAADHDITLQSFRHLRLFIPNYLKNRKLFRFHVGRPLLRDLAARAPWSRARQRPFSWDRDFEPAPNPAKIQRSVDEFRRLFPSIAGPTIEQAWAGDIDVTPDMLPVIGHVGRPTGLVLATGFSGHGFAMGPVVGRLVAELIVDGKPSFDLSGFRLSRFTEGLIAPARNVV